MTDPPPCPACRAIDWVPQFTTFDLAHGMTGFEFPVAACGSCGLGRTIYPPGAPDPATTYPSTYSFHQPEDARARGPRSRWIGEREAHATGSFGYWRWCDPRYGDFESIGPGPGARVLDIGCGSGRFLRRFRDLGWKAQGIEPSPTAAALARADGFEVAIGTLEETPIPPETYDLLFLHHSFEHSRDPAGSMAKCAAALRPGGTIALALCNFDAPGRRFFEGAWPPLEVPRHRFHYSPRSTARLLTAHGLAPEKVYFHNSLGDFAQAVRRLRRLDRARRGAWTARPKGSGRRVYFAGPDLLFAWYAPLLHAISVDSQAAFLILGRRPSAPSA